MNGKPFALVPDENLIINGIQCASGGQGSGVKWTSQEVIVA